MSGRLERMEDLIERMAAHNMGEEDAAHLFEEAKKLAAPELDERKLTASRDREWIDCLRKTDWFKVNIGVTLPLSPNDMHKVVSDLMKTGESQISARVNRAWAMFFGIDIDRVAVELLENCDSGSVHTSKIASEIKKAIIAEKMGNAGTNLEDALSFVNRVRVDMTKNPGLPNQMTLDRDWETEPE